MRKMCWFIAIAGGFASVFFAFYNRMDDAIWCALFSMLFMEFAKVVEKM